MGGKKCTVLVGKLSRPYFGVCLWEVLAYERCLLAEIRLLHCMPTIKQYRQSAPVSGHPWESTGAGC